MSYLDSVTIIGFVGADPEQRQARNNNGSKFTVCPSQRSGRGRTPTTNGRRKRHSVCALRRRLAEYVSTTIKKGSHVLVEQNFSYEEPDDAPLEQSGIYYTLAS